MYPFFWTSRERGNFMRYSYEFRLKCVEEHRKGRYSETPEGVSEESFRSKVRHGTESLISLLKKLNA